MESKKYRTRQDNKSMTNPKGKEYIMGIDIGYSGTKIFVENGCICFPSYAKKLEGMLNSSDEKDILYQEDGSNEIYMIGYNAQNMTDDMDTNDTDGELFSRKRYLDKRFKIIVNTALALATDKKNDNRKLFVQTGLPSSYMSDADNLKKVFCKPASFKLKIGDKEWKHYSFELLKEQIDVMPQPSGGYYSVLTLNDGNEAPNARELLCGNTLVMDIGFDTFDWFGTKGRSLSCRESSDEIGMKEVFEKTCKKILDDTQEDIRVSSIQKKLEDGYFEAVNEEDLTSEQKSISGYLEEAENEIFEEAIRKAKSVTNSFRGYQNLIISGGTGEAWLEKIREKLKGMKTLKIIPSNVNDHLPMIYSNARGYYFFRYRKMIGKK